MIELTRQQREAVANEKNPVFVDPETRNTFVLVRKEVFDQFAKLFVTDDYDPDEGMALINEVMSEDDANDPLLESYQQFRKEPS